MWSWGFRQSNCLDRIWHYRRQQSSVIPRDCEKRLHGSSDLFRSEEAERILLCETVNSCWQWIQSKHHVRVPQRGSCYLVNYSVRSRNHTMSVTLNLGAVGIIWSSCKPVHILYLKPLHSRVRSQSALIFFCRQNLRALIRWGTISVTRRKISTSLKSQRDWMVRALDSRPEGPEFGPAPSSLKSKATLCK